MSITGWPQSLFRWTLVACACVDMHSLFCPLLGTHTLLTTPSLVSVASRVNEEWSPSGCRSLAVTCFPAAEYLIPPTHSRDPSCSFMPCVKSVVGSVTWSLVQRF